MSRGRFSKEGQRQTSRLSCFNQSYISKCAAGGGGGFFFGQAAGDEFLDLFFEVFADFIGEIVVEAAAREELF